MSAEELDELFRLIGGVVKLKAEFEGDGFIVSAVEYQNRTSYFSDEVDCGIIEPCEPTDGHIGVEFFADIDVRGKSALDNKGSGLDFVCQICCDGAAERQAEDNNLLGRNTFLFSKPPVGRSHVEVGSVFGGTSLAVSVAAVIEDEAIKAEGVKEINRIEEEHHIAAVAVAEEDGEFGVVGGLDASRSGDEPAVELEAVAGFEENFFKIESKLRGGIRQFTNGVVNELWLHKIKNECKANIGHKKHSEKG